VDASAWLREYQQETQDRLAKAEQIREQVNAAVGSATSPDGVVSVTVGPTGALQALEISARAEGMPPARLSQLILRTSREAHRRVAEQMALSVKPLIGDSEAMHFLESQVPPAEEAGGPQQQQRQPTQRPSWDDDDPDSGPIMR